MKAALNPARPVLIIDDEEQLLISFDTMLRMNGINNIITCHDSRNVMQVLNEQEIGIMLLDLYMPWISGEELLPQVCSRYPQVPVVVVTGVDNVDTAVTCIKAGAFDYMVKPVEEGRLLTSVKRAIEFRALQEENTSLKDRVLSNTLEHPEAFLSYITDSEAMQSIFKYAEVIAKTPMPVLITGETGVGKELMIEAIHTLSPCTGKLIKINVAGLDDNVFTDTLFGHAKGAFTDAVQARSGLVERAQGGTLFLDEIGDLSAASQVKLLRLIQEHEYYRLGDDEPRLTDARIVVATNHDLNSLLNKETFRQDLYYRLTTHHIHIPPLRERIEDIPVLVQYFIEAAAKKCSKKPPSFPKELFAYLATYDFPGNIRELQSIIFDVVSRHTSRMLSLDAFKPYISKKDSALPLESLQLSQSPEKTFFSQCSRLPTLKKAEQDLIAEALLRADNNQSIAARLLGISRQALNRRLTAEKNT